MSEIPADNLIHSPLNQRQQLDIMRGKDPFLTGAYVMSLTPEEVAAMPPEHQAILEEAHRIGQEAQQRSIAQHEYQYPEVHEITKPQARAVGERALRFATQQGSPGEPEIFDTVQGEGRNLGRPVVFARLSGCNLQCSWCDTPYTWAFNEKLAAKHDEGKAYDRQQEQIKLQVGEAVDRITGYPLRRLVITGGEPMTQQKGIADLIKGLREVDPNYWVEIETNGTIAPSEELHELVDQFNVSPKLANSGNELAKRRKMDALKSFAGTPKADFKFVVMKWQEMDEILDIVDAFHIPHERVFIMPEGRTEEEVKTHQEQLVEVCKAMNFNLTTRLHVLIWGAKRGV